MVERELAGIVKKVMGDGKEEETRKIVKHLMSNDVGVSAVSDLPDITIDMLPNTLIPPVKANRLLREFGIYAQGLLTVQPGPSAHQYVNPAPEALSLPSTSGTPSSRTGDNFSFKVPWNSLPKNILDNLDKAEKMPKPRVDVSDVLGLKRAIVTKLIGAYNEFRETHKGAQKHPGRKIYTSIAEQVLAKYKKSMVDIINGKVVGKGSYSFAKAVEISVENKLREKDGKQTRVTAKRGKGVVGILLPQFDPQVTLAEKEKQMGLRENMQNLSMLEEDYWDWEQIKDDLKNTYELQRHDILEQREEVFNTEQEEEREGSSLNTLKSLWPFLFTPIGIREHHNRITGRNLAAPMEEFIQEHMEFLYMFMTSGSASNTLNLALRLNLEAHSANIRNSQKILAVFCMVANHFKEDHTQVLEGVEKTTLPSELPMTKDLSIFALDLDKFSADSYIICVDHTPLIEICDGSDVITPLVELCFVLDLKYPDLPLTFEFFERYVYGLGMPDSKITNKKGKQLLVLTEAVKKLVNALEDFEDTLKKTVK